MKGTGRKKWIGVGVVFLLFLIIGVSQSFAQTYGLGQLSSGNYGKQTYTPFTFSTVSWMQYIVSALLGSLVGAFFSQQFRKYRRWILFGLLCVGTVIGFCSNNLFADAALFLIFAGIFYYAFREAIITRRKKPTTFGSAEWADLDHLTNNKLIGSNGFSLGVFETREGAYPLCYTGDRHLMTIAPTRSGKGVSSIIPNLLTYQGSAVVIDPKGENAMITALRRGKGDAKRGIQGLGQTVHVVDPWGITGLPSSCFNPLDWLNPDDPDINENAMILADSLIAQNAGGYGHDQFWNEEAKALLMGVLLWVALDEDEKENRTMGRVRDIISMGAKELNGLLAKMSNHTNHIIKGAGARTLSKEEKLQSSVLAALQSHTHFLDSPSIRASLATSDFRFEDLKTTKMTVYLVLPADRLGAFGRWLRLLIQQALTVNARNIEIKPDKPILFLLDEMATLGRLSMVEEAYGLMAGFGMQLWGIVQDLSQLHRIYGDGWQTFIGNSGVIQYFGSRDLMTAEYFSKMCGVTTIEKVSIGTSIAKAFSSSSGSGNSSSSSQSTTYSDSYNTDLVGRPLAYPDELMVMRDNKQVVFIESFNPIPARKVPWYQNEELKQHGVDLHKNTLGPKDRKPKPEPEKPQQDSSARPKASTATAQKQEALETARIWEWLEKGHIDTAIYVLNKAGYSVTPIGDPPSKYKLKSPSGTQKEVEAKGLIRTAKAVFKNGGDKAA